MYNYRGSVITKILSRNRRAQPVRNSETLCSLLLEIIHYLVYGFDCFRFLRQNIQLGTTLLMTKESNGTYWDLQLSN